MGEVFKGFFTDFGAELRRNGGDLGKALMESLSSAAMEAASQAWEKVGNMAANFLVNAVLGQPSTGLLQKSIGFTGANTTLGEILGAGTSLPANDNVAGGFSGLSAAASGLSGMSAYPAAGDFLFDFGRDVEFGSRGSLLSAVSVNRSSFGKGTLVARIGDLGYRGLGLTDRGTKPDCLERSNVHAAVPARHVDLRDASLEGHR